MGTLEVSENTYLQVFLLPSSRQYFPLWRAFSEGTVGAFYLHGGDKTGDLKSFGTIKSFIEEDLKRPLVVRAVNESAPAPGHGTYIFRELFNRILDGESESEVVQQ